MLILAAVAVWALSHGGSNGGRPATFEPTAQIGLTRSAARDLGAVAPRLKRFFGAPARQWVVSAPTEALPPLGAPDPLILFVAENNVRVTNPGDTPIARATVTMFDTSKGSQVNRCVFTGGSSVPARAARQCEYRPGDKSAAVWTRVTSTAPVYVSALFWARTIVKGNENRVALTGEGYEVR